MTGTTILPEENRIGSEKTKESWCLLRKDVGEGPHYKEMSRICNEEMEVVRREESSDV